MVRSVGSRIRTGDERLAKPQVGIHHGPDIMARSHRRRRFAQAVQHDFALREMMHDRRKASGVAGLEQQAGRPFRYQLRNAADAAADHAETVGRCFNHRDRGILYESEGINRWSACASKACFASP